MIPIHSNRSTFGEPVTLASGWQADFNNVGSNVNASDLAYLAGRLGAACSAQKASTYEQSFQMRIENLKRSEVRSLLQRTGVSVPQILAAWDEMGLSYDRSRAGEVLTSDDSFVANAAWSSIKKLYR